MKIAGYLIQVIYALILMLSRRFLASAFARRVIWSLRNKGKNGGAPTDSACSNP